MEEIKISKKSRDRGDDGYRIISVRIKLETLECIEDIASKTARSRNEVVNILLSEAIEHAVVDEK